MHQQNMIWFAILICHFHRMVFDVDGRYTKVKRDTQEFIHVLLIIVDTRDPAIILYADGKISSVGVGHGSNRDSKVARRDPRGFSIHDLLLRRELQVMEIVRVKWHSKTLPNYLQKA